MHSADCTMAEKSLNTHICTYYQFKLKNKHMRFIINLDFKINFKQYYERCTVHAHRNGMLIVC